MENQTETPFVREDRYLVLKRKDLATLPPTSQNALNDWLDDHFQTLPTREYVVVESDWPEYETVFKMIEARVTGSAAILQSTALPDHSEQHLDMVAALPVGELTKLWCETCEGGGTVDNTLGGDNINATDHDKCPDCDGNGYATSSASLRKLLSGEQKEKLVGSYFADQWAKDAAFGMLDDYETIAAARPQPVLEPEIEHVNCDDCTYHYKDADQKPCNTCIHSGDFVSNFEPRHGITQGGKA